MTGMFEIRDGEKSNDEENLHPAELRNATTREEDYDMHFSRLEVGCKCLLMLKS